MRLSTIASLLAGNLSYRECSAQIANELIEHVRGLQNFGGAAPVYVNEDADIVLDRSGLGVLCVAFASGDLTGSELAYIADVLTLAERVEFSGEDVRNDLEECTDPIVNGPMTVARALEIAGEKLQD
jgi:hypothetical protein